jgi:hypothetical protein
MVWLGFFFSLFFFFQETKELTRPWLVVKLVALQGPSLGDQEPLGFLFLLLLQSVGTIVCLEVTLGYAEEVEGMLISVQINALS